MAGFTVSAVPDVVESDTSVFVTVMVPPPVLGTVNVIVELVNAITSAAVPATCTNGRELPKSVPVIVTLSPTQVAGGENDVMVGPGWVVNVILVTVVALFAASSTGEHRKKYN